MDDLSSKMLKAIARENGVKGWKTMNKTKLMEALLPININFKKLSKPELNSIAKLRRIKGYNKMNKADLAEAVSSSAPSTDIPIPGMDNLSSKVLKAIARENGIQNYERMSKTKIVEALQQIYIILDNLNVTELRSLANMIIKLLLYSNGETNHYIWIINRSKLFRSILTKDNHAYELCPRYFKCCKTVESLEDHLELCSDHDAVRIEMPMDKDGKPLYHKFKNYHKQIQVPIVGYGDFECFNRKIHSCSPDDRNSYTEKYQKHIPSECSIYFKAIDDEVFKLELKIHTAESDEDDVAQKFVDTLESSVRRIWNTVNFNKPFDGNIPEDYRVSHLRR